jgi:hypothetical protein
MVAKIAIHIADLSHPETAGLRQCCGPEGCGYFNKEPHPGRWCVGAYCMAWRWFETHLPDANGDLVKNGEVYGFCGLAGDPSPRRAA